METFRAFMEIFPAIAMLALICILGGSTLLFSHQLDAYRKEKDAQKK